MNEQDRSQPERAHAGGVTRALSVLFGPRAALHRTLLFALTVFLPLSLGARECERVPIGECSPDAGEACGCEYDGKIYAFGERFKSSDGCNECSCDTSGQVACTLRACAPVTHCGGIAGLQCPEGQYCDYAPEAQCGAADQTGTCKVKPQACTFEYSPVCGCDDKTYGNACDAAASGVSIVRRGECESAPGCEYNGKRYAVGERYPSTDGCNTCTCDASGSSACTERACGGGGAGAACGSRGLPLECAPGLYCKRPIDAMCGRADAPGVCSEIPQACTKEYKPVCGCDGKTYGNTCMAGSAGVSVDYEGECKGGCEYEGKHYAEGETFTSSDGCNGCGCNDGQVVCDARACLAPCGGLAGLSCKPGEFCDYAPEALCGAADATGFCKPVPEVCTEEYAPVCGCDDKTYGNACAANAAGISARAKGECGATADGCDYEGTHYPVGASFPSSDGCNTCGCSENGLVACTLKACAPTGKTCGGFAALKCEANEYCSFPSDANCGFADQTGVCQVRPDVCPAVYAPVCGCDGKTYSSSCDAAAKGISTKSDGECK